ncbi:DUF397 domain-containing protein [Streptomyces sp. BA2]|uniref:DUF397 domain-containing protein n=1 Tax=Streptomyces sp. BA2 TaxID=436595 RepID=UPI001329EA54|nr:DUF397 domain-containing protein [Streptomyces sp. BA2]MWA12440.1 DUF397 domain-containing protein [Streptomyces sp. BA2]
MGTTHQLAGARWRRSSYSGTSGGECIECAPLNGTAWRKSSYSSDTGGECIEFAPREGGLALRDSKNPEGPVFTISPGAFARFVRAAADGGLTAP